ncbi:hypothetical protein [Aquirufa antheringensis]
MKKIVFFFLISVSVFAQTGIGTTTPHASAKLDVSSTNKGFLPPRVTLTGISDNSTIASPATGLLVYNTGDNVGLAAGYYFWNGNAWATIATAGGSGSFAASFVRGSRTASQSSIAVGGIVSFSAVDNTSGQDISLNTTNGKITLAPGNTYRLIAAVPNFSGSRPAFMWYNETSSSYIGSATNGYSPTDGAANAGAFGGLAEVVITPNVSTVLSFRLLSSQSSGAVTVGGLVDFSTTGSYPWFEAQVISGNAPVTGQSVDYGIARFTGADGGSLTTGALVGFDAIAPGNITWSGNKFTLKANKTYELESYLAIYQSVGWVSGIFQIYDYTNNAALANGLYMSMQGNAAFNPNANGLMRAIITPTSDIQVGIKFVSFSGAAYAPGLIGSANAVTGAAPNQCYFLAKQIGSSAIINPWVLSGSDSYNTTGKVGIGTNAPTSTLDVTGNINVTGKINVTDPSGNVVVKAAGFVNESVPVTLGDIQIQMAPNGQARSLQIKTTGTSFTGMVTAYTAYNGASGTNAFTHFSDITQTINSTFAHLGATWGFAQSGDVANYFLRDTTNLRFYRITLMVGPSFNTNFISIERLL